MSELHYIDRETFKSLIDSDLPWQEKTALFADYCRVNALYMIQQAGSGHIGSSFSSLDLVSYLFLNRLDLHEDVRRSRDIYFSSKGHDVPGLYAALTGLGKLDFELIHQLRRLNGLPGHPDCSIPYCFTNTGSLGMGISKAKGFIHAKRARQQAGKVYVLTGDGELQEGQFWESLIGAANHAMAELTVIIDHNKIQSDTWVTEVSDLGELEDKLASFGWYVQTCDGHYLKDIHDCLSRCDHETQRPQIIIAHTDKGSGVTFMDYKPASPDELYAYHSGALSEQHYGEAFAELRIRIEYARQASNSAPVVFQSHSWTPPTVPAAVQKLIPAYSEALMVQARNNDQIMVLDADLMLDCGLVEFKNIHPKRFFECGIAEQDMVSQAGALALQGFLPVVHSFACFLSARPNEQIYTNASEKTKIIYTASLAGVLPGGPGHSHQSVRDISALAAVPGLVMVEPATVAELHKIMDFAVNINPQSTYIRLVSIPWEVPFQSNHERIWLGQGHVVRQGKDVVIFGYGPVLLSQAMKAAEQLDREHGLSAKVVNLPWLNRIDEDWLAETVGESVLSVTLDNHYIKGGQGEMIAAAMARSAVPSKVIHLGVTGIPVCGRNEQVLKAHGLDAQSISDQVFGNLKGQSHGVKHRTTTKLGS